MLLDWAFAIGHPWIGAVIVMVVVFSFLIIARLEKDK